MANRPIFVPESQGPAYVKTIELDFRWYPGFALAQAQRSIQSLHKAAETEGYRPILEISSKSEEQLGIDLSAFNLMLTHEGQSLSVECAFQGSKRFESGGPYRDLYAVSSREARRDRRIRESGELMAFQYFDLDFPTKPVTAFYDWLYINALDENRELADQLSSYQGFTDIAFNPKRSWNCQAHAAALYVALEQAGILADALRDVENYLRIITDKPSSSFEQAR